MISIPADRTSSQPVKCVCRNPACAETSDAPFEFAADGSAVICPKCGASDPASVSIQVLVHLLLPDPEGPVTGMHGRRWKIGCETKRAYLATVTNLEAATVVKEAANCPGCLAAAAAENPVLVI